MTVSRSIQVSTNDLILFLFSIYLSLQFLSAVFHTFQSICFVLLFLNLFLNILFDVILNGIMFLISFLDCSLQIYS